MLNMELVTLFNKKRILLFLLPGIFFATFSCKKAEDRRCFKTVGEEIVKTVKLPSFDKLILREHIEYVLIQDSTDKLVIKGGKNLVNFVEWQVHEDKFLELKNRNKCGFLRNLKHKVLVEIHCTDVSNIHFEGTEPFTNVGTLKTPFFVLLVRDGAGSVKLNLDTYAAQADISHGWGDYTLTGTTFIARIAARSNGYCDATGLNILDSVYMSNESSGIVKLRVNGIPFLGEIKGNGDTWYYGTPSLIDVKLPEFGKGKLVKKD